MNEGDCPVLPGSDQWEAGREHQCNAINSAICYSWVPGTCRRHQWKPPLPQRGVLRQVLSTHEGSGQSWHVVLLVGLRLGGATLGRDTYEGWDCCGTSPWWKASMGLQHHSCLMFTRPTEPAQSCEHQCFGGLIARLRGICIAFAGTGAVRLGYFMPRYLQLRS